MPASNATTLTARPSEPARRSVLHLGRVDDDPKDAPRDFFRDVIPAAKASPWKKDGEKIGMS